MELCSDNLQNIIQQKSEFFGREVFEKSIPMEPIEYFISCQLFQEVLECLQYLHDHNIMHRDIKPANILINEKPVNSRFIKICDFGLAKLYEKNKSVMITATHTTGQGTPNYYAPEVRWKNHYSAKCDIYSLGVLSTELFDL